MNVVVFPYTFRITTIPTICFTLNQSKKRHSSSVSFCVVSCVHPWTVVCGDRRRKKTLREPHGKHKNEPLCNWTMMSCLYVILLFLSNTSWCFKKDTSDKHTIIAVVQSFPALLCHPMSFWGFWGLCGWTSFFHLEQHFRSDSKWSKSLSLFFKFSIGIVIICTLYCQHWISNEFVLIRANVDLL